MWWLVPAPAWEWIDHKLIVPLPIDYFARRTDNGICLFGIEQAKIAVDFSRCHLDHTHRPDKSRAGA
jgi:hypothetical protein